MANPVPWDQVENWAIHGDQVPLCLVELRSRVEALEANARRQPPASTAGLVELVRDAIAPVSVEQEPRAAIRAVAHWLRANWWEQAADRLEQELAR
jgi:hypothetical protein